MIDNHELPIGFAMELAQHSDILNRFATLPKPKQEQVVNGARKVESRGEMRNYVENMFRGWELTGRQKGTGKTGTLFHPFLLFF